MKIGDIDRLISIYTVWSKGKLLGKKIRGEYYKDMYATQKYKCHPWWLRLDIEKIYANRYSEITVEVIAE